LLGKKKVPKLSKGNSGLTGKSVQKLNKQSPKARLRVAPSKNVGKTPTNLMTVVGAILRSVLQKIWVI